MNINKIERFEILDSDGRANLYGACLFETEEIIAIAEFENWQFNGILFTRLISVTNHSESEHTLFWQKVLTSVPGSKFNFDEHVLDFSNLHDVFKYCCDKNLLVVIEGTDGDEFEVVKIIALTSSTIEIKSIDSIGQWAGNNKKIKISDINLVKLFDPYCEGIQSFLQLIGKY